MLRPVLMCLVLCIVYGNSKPAEKKSRVHPDELLSKLEHDDAKNFDYDHEAFLGEDDAKTFDHLPPEESRRRLGIIVTKIDANSDGYISEKEMKDWIQKTQHKHIKESVDSQWNDFDLNKDNLITWEEYKNVTYGDSINDPHPEDGYNYDRMMARDERRFKVADRDGDLKANREEFAAFLYPEENELMKDIVVQETMEDIDKNGDGFIDLKEYIGDMFTPDSDKDPEPDWVVSERQQFAEFRDKNNDGKMDREETEDWILPKDYDHAEAEAKHLLHEADQNNDGKLSPSEILEKYDLFVGSQVTNFGEALMRHDEF